MEKISPDKSAARSLGASFRDPAGFVFKNSKGQVLRQVNQAGKDDFNLFIKSGLYESLVKDKLIVSHKVVPNSRSSGKQSAAIIRPQQIAYISYPFEWSFSQLQDAALLTLEIQKRALKHGMTLKDASAYNVQFQTGRPVFIDTLSFEKYEAGKPWQAYRQFCQHFLAPLTLAAYTDLSLPQLLRIHLDGIPLDLTSKLLPRSARFKPGLVMHVILHGRAQKAKAADHKPRARTVKKASLEAIVDSLERSVKKLKLRKTATEWGDYYGKTNYTSEASGHKAKSVTKLVKPLHIKTALDLGGNDGTYSRLLHGLDIFTVCTDIDPIAVEANYRSVKQRGEVKMLPLLVDLTNPGGALGWANSERELIQERLQVDIVMALALIHHLAISNNLPFDMIARYFKKFGKYLLIEFVPKEDSQVQKLLSTREDIFPEYDEYGFKKAFSRHYTFLDEVKIKGTKRTLYLCKRKR